MTEFWLGVIAGAIGVWTLGTITVIAIRGAARETPTVGGGYWDDDSITHELDALLDDERER